MVAEVDAERFQLLQNIDSIIGSSYKLPRVMRKIYKEIKKVFDTSNFYIAIYHPEDNSISFEIYTIDGKELSEDSRKLSGGLTEYVIETKKPLLLNRDIKKFCRRHRIKHKDCDAKSWLGVPMIYKNNVEGVMVIRDYEKYDRYSRADLSVLMSVASRTALIVANTRLIQGEMERAKQLSLMNQIARRLIRSLNIDDICSSVTKSIIQKFKNYNVSIFLIEDDKLVLRKLSRGFRAEIPGDLKLNFGQGIVGNAALSGKTIVANDVTKESRYLSFAPTTTRSEVAIPLKISRRVIGVLNIECNEVNAFNSDTVKILELIADRLSAALHNAKLYQDAVNYARDLTVSSAITRLLISPLEFDDVLDRMFEVIIKKIGVANIAILLIDPEKKELYIRASHGYSQHIKKKIRLKIGKEGICGYVAATGKPYYAPDVSKVSFYISGKHSIKSEAAIPLKIKGRIIGVLNIESEKLNAFTEQDIRLFSMFTAQTAIAIENARLFDETKSFSLTDGLTKIANRRYFELMLDNEFRKARGYSRPVSLAMIDLDDFKKFNDHYGHPAGDKMLIHIARLLKRSIRDTDFVARYGGEEFCVIFPETDSSPALKIAERVRKAVKNNPVQLKGGGTKGITVSIGVATYPVNAFSPDELVRNADKAIYRAKRLGKDRVETV